MNLKIPTPKYSQDMPKFALTREHARPGLASRTSCHRRKYATSKSIAQHWITLTTAQQLDKPTRTSRLRADKQHKPLHDPDLFSQESQDIPKLAFTREHGHPGLAS